MLRARRLVSFIGPAVKRGRRWLDKPAWPAAYLSCFDGKRFSVQVKILVAITGASGVIYAQRLLDWLGETEHETHVVLSSYAQAVIRQELPTELRLPEGVVPHGLKSMNAPFASGSNVIDAMVVIPCTMGTLGRIAHGYSDNVLLRAADVALKENRKLILVSRETPLNLVCLLYTSPSPRDATLSRMPSSA